MKKTIIRYVVSSIITWLAGFVGAVLVLLDSVPVNEIPLDSAFWFGVLMIGVRVAIKTVFESLPNLIKEISLWVAEKKQGNQSKK